LSLIAVNVMGTGITITPPAPGTGIPPWTQLGTTIDTGKYEQALFWHEVGTATSEEIGSFTFTYSSSVRGACAGVSYTNTCLQNPVPCTSPIFDYSSGSAVNSFPTQQQVTQAGTSLFQMEPSGQLGVPPLGEVVGFYGSKDPFSEFGITANATANTNGGAYTPTTGTFTGGLVGPVTGRFGVNGGIDVASKSFSAAVDGPFPASLPDRNDPTGGFAISSISGNGTTASGTTTSTNLAYIGTLQGYIQGNSNAGFNTPGGGTTVTLTTSGSTDFSFANTTVGTGTGGSLFIQDPAAADSVSQVVSLISETP